MVWTLTVCTGDTHGPEGGDLLGGEELILQLVDAETW